MLKINKLLSKKIKFLLSLRGAKRRSNLSGFSLIELMVAVAILAMAIFGIFHAYSAGFMGMADARDRTVATNYAQEAMEDIKNKDFDQIITQSRAFISGTKYEREVIVQPSTNLKKVTTNVYWKDRNGNTKIVETDMVINFIETTAEAATKIILYADPYNILTTGTSTLTAVVKDAKGNTVTTYSGEVTFSITDGNIYGDLPYGSDTDTVDSTKGIATTTFIASAVGEVIITASSGSLITDSVSIQISDIDKPVKINLKAEPPKMKPGGEYSTITATVVNAGGGTVAISKEITFSVSGPGYLSTPTTLSTVDKDGNPTGIATITLTSNSPPGGTITVTASSSELEPGIIDVITGGQITLSASPMEVPKGEQSVITVTTKDVNGVPINYKGIIDFVVVESDGGSGTLLPETVIFGGSTSSKEVIFTATSDEGTVNITAIDTDEILTDSNILTLTVKEELTPHHIEVYATPSSIPAGGTETSIITAKVKTISNVTITSNNDPVNFKTTLGNFASVDTNFTKGIATAILNPISVPGTATITVCSPSDVSCTITGKTTVGFYIGAHHIILSAVPQNILAGGQYCTVTAKIVDNNGILVSGYNEDITFIISPWPNTIKFSKATTYILTQKVKKGIATVTLISGTIAGTAVIDAYSKNISGSLNIPVGISLKLAEPDNIIYNYIEPYYVSFDIDVQGADLILEEMQVSWEVGDPVETLDKIDIAGITIYDNDPSDLVGSIFYTDSSNERIADIDITDTTLSTGTSTIVMYFSGDISGKTTLDVTFNPNSGDYLVDLIPL